MKYQLGDWENNKQIYTSSQYDTPNQVGLISYLGLLFDHM